jgi:hypothetical protein
MKDSVSVLGFIDALYARYLVNPGGYASNPMALEEIFFTLEQVREFALSEEDSEAMPHGKEYAAYLNRVGCGTATYSHRMYEQSNLSHALESHAELFPKLVAHISRYLKETRPNVDFNNPGGFFDRFEER